MSENKPKKRGLFGWFGKSETAKEEASQEELEQQVEQDLEVQKEDVDQTIPPEMLEELEKNLAESTEFGEESSEEFNEDWAIDSDAASPELEQTIKQLEESDAPADLEAIDEIFEEAANSETNTQVDELAEIEEVTSPVEEMEIVAEEVLSEEIVTDEPVAEEQTPEPEQSQPAEKKGFFGRLKSGLSKTRSQLTDGIADLVLGSKQIDDDLLEDIETQLLMADVGVEATTKIIDDLTDMAGRKELKDADALMTRLKELLSEIVAPCSKPLVLDKKPYVILMVGVNGVGKTTTIGKLAKKFQSEGKSVMLAAGDTFRAAAVEQLQVWGERNDIHVTAQHTGADSASVIFDALQAAQARDVDVLIADTAGRLHTKSNLMDELSKVKRVMQKLDQEAPHEIMMVVDACTGQNALSQAEHFHKAVGLTGISISKLDGTAKGGVVFAMANKLPIPIRFIGVGEGIDDLREFNSKDFIDALFDKPNND